MSAVDSHSSVLSLTFIALAPVYPASIERPTGAGAHEVVHAFRYGLGRFGVKCLGAQPQCALSFYKATVRRDHGTTYAQKIRTPSSASPSVLAAFEHDRPAPLHSKALQMDPSKHLREVD